MTILLESAIRVTLIAAVIALVLFAMRIKTASVLHAVWAGVVVLMLLLPAWVAWGPRASLPVLAPDRTPAMAVLPPPLPAGLAEATPRTTPVPSPAREGGGYSLTTAVYLLGLGILLLRLVIGTVRASRLKSCVAPITVGILHPRIVLPESAKDWSQAQLDAVLVHEGEHIRRRDPLFQWIALFNRAIFWFHPLSWWLERRLSGLAEEACDAAVIARGHDPGDYSEYLLDLARSMQRAGTRIDAVGMAMPGIGLKHRIRKMLSGIPVPKISRLRLACTVAVCASAAAILAAGTLAHAQLPGSPSVQPALEVASVKLRVPGQGDGSIRFSVSGNRVILTNISLHGLLTTAYDIKIYQILGTPNWGDTNRYDVEAKAEGEDALTREQGRQLLQKVLADRFQVILHREAKEMPVYALVAGNRPKLKPSGQDGDPLLMMNGAGRNVRITVTKGTMEQLAQHLSNNGGVDRPVLDRTGLTGNYDYRLEWTQSGSPAPDTNEVSIFTAVQEQLGLKMEATRAPVEVLVIDRAEKPSEN